MMETHGLDDYRTLLTIRQAGRRRDAFITGAVFALAFISALALGMLDRLAGRELYFVAALIAVFGISFLMAWIRLEIVKGSIELINNL
jgi:hypothetical protein